MVSRKSKEEVMRKCGKWSLKRADEAGERHAGELDGVIFSLLSSVRCARSSQIWDSTVVYREVNQRYLERDEWSLSGLTSLSRTVVCRVRRFIETASAELCLGL